MNTRIVMSSSLLVLMLASTSLFAVTLSPLPSAAYGIQVDVWTNRGEGAVYQYNEPYDVYFRTTADCFITLYEISAEGHVRMIFPRYPDDGFVYGGVTYRLPEYYASDQLFASSQRGIQFVQAVATDTPNRFRWREYGGRYDFQCDPVTGDPFVAINSINDRLLPHGYLRAQATTSFFVGGQVWYPRYACASCHTSPHSRYDPYTSVCTKYTVVTAQDYDYFWEYDYHPRLVAFSFSGPFWRFEIRTSRHWRHARFNYVDCAHGYRNYYPLHPPTYRYVYRERHSPRQQVYRTYQREYTPLSYERSRGRNAGSTRDRDQQRISPTPSRDRRATIDPADPSSSRARGNEVDRGVPSTGRDRGTAPGPSAVPGPERERGSQQQATPSSSRDSGNPPPERSREIRTERDIRVEAPRERIEAPRERVDPPRERVSPPVRERSEAPVRERVSPPPRERSDAPSRERSSTPAPERRDASSGRDRGGR